MSTSLVSVISVNFNEPQETIEFLDSLYKSDYTNFETIIVDNGSTRKIDKKLEKEYPNLTCIIHDENLGFAGGNNLGIKIAKGNFLLFLNNDTLVPNKFVSRMAEFMESNPQVGIASPKVVYPDGLVQYAGATDLHPLTGRGKIIGWCEEDKEDFNKVYPTGLPHGAAMIVSSEALGKVGPMPELYFLYYEELDWCMQIKKEGYLMYYVGDTYVIHKESVSVGQESTLKVYYMNRNRILYQMRNTQGIQLLFSILFYFFIALPKGSIKYLLSGKQKHFRSLWRAVLWHFNRKFVFKK